MKKNSLLKVLGIAFIVYVILSWIFPVGNFQAGEYVKGELNPIGLFDLGYYPLMTVSTFMQYGVFFLTIGGLYGVLNKIGIHEKMVANTADKFNNKKVLFAMVTIVGIALFVSLTGLVMPVMILLPFLFAVMYRLGYSKQSSAAAVIGAIFAGVIGNTTGYHAVLVSNYLHTELFDFRYLVFKAVLFVLVTGLLVVYVIRHSKNDLATVPADNRYDVLLYENTGSTTKSTAPLVIIAIIVAVLVTISMYPWELVNISLFTDIYEKIMGFEIKGFPIFAKIIGGTMSPFGYWGNSEISVVIVLMSVLVGWLYGVKFGEIVKSFGEGCKKVFSVAFYAAIAGVIFVIMINTQQNIGFTLINYVSRLVDGFNVVTTSLMAAITSFFYNDFNYTAYNLISVVSPMYNDVTVNPIIGIITQTIYGIMMLFTPVSVVLLAGLRMFDVNYKDWFKYMWKYILEIAVIVIAVLLIISAI